MRPSAIDLQLVYDVAREVPEKELRPLLEHPAGVEAVTRLASSPCELNR